LKKNAKDPKIRANIFKSGDAVWCPPDIDHWHGATPNAPMTHLVLTGVLDGKNVIWKEKVTDEQYLGK
jgi:quercetin dioxygenase-like cupin family protein